MQAGSAVFTAIPLCRKVQHGSVKIQDNALLLKSGFYYPCLKKALEIVCSHTPRAIHSSLTVAALLGKVNMRGLTAHI
jgi:hypothetical protein